MRSGPPGREVAGGRRAAPRASRLQRLRLVHEYDGDVVLDAVHELARLADDLLLRLAELQLALALGAGENLLQFRGDGHDSLLSRNPRQLPEPRLAAIGFVRPRPGHGRPGRAVEESEAQEVPPHEAPEWAQRHPQGAAAVAPGMEHGRGPIAVPLHLAQAILQRIVRMVDDGRVQPPHPALDEELLVHAALRIVAARVAAEEPDMAIRPEAAVPQPDAVEVVLEGQRIGGEGAVGLHAGQLRRGALVGIDREHPLSARLRAGELMLPGEVIEGPAQHARARFRGQLGGAIARAAVDHQHLAAEPAHRGNAGADLALLVLRDDRRRDQSRALSRDKRSVVEWSLGSPAITVRPPQEATRSRSGTLSSV